MGLKCLPRLTKGLAGGASLGRGPGFRPREEGRPERGLLLTDTVERVFGANVQ